MAVTITSPQSKFVSRSNANSLTISWSCQYPQSAYEIAYRQKGTSAWSTFGKVTSTATSATINISNFNDFIEYHYRVISYAENKTSGSSVYNGSDTSAAYALMIVPDVQLGTLKVKYGDGMVEVPLYESVQSPNKIKIQNRMTALIDRNLSASTAVQVQENGEIKTLAKQPETLENTGQYAYAYMTQKQQFSSSYTYYNYVSSNYTYYNYGGSGTYRYYFPYYTRYIGYYLTGYYWKYSYRYGYRINYRYGYKVQYYKVQYSVYYLWYDSRIVTYYYYNRLTGYYYYSRSSTGYKYYYQTSTFYK